MFGAIAENLERDLFVLRGFIVEVSKRTVEKFDKLQFQYIVYAVKCRYDGEHISAVIAYVAGAACYVLLAELFGLTHAPQAVDNRHVRGIIYLCKI